MIENPILPGFNPDPCICRKGDDFFLAVSTFEWMPAIPVYHSKDLKNWEFYSHVLTNESTADLKKLPSAKGIWAPCLTYCEKEDMFYVIYGVMNSMNARYFDVDNFLVKSKDLKNWSEPVYLHSAGFDASILHDDDGKKYIVSLLWETRDGYEKPGTICISEYDDKEKRIKDYPKSIYRGGTDRGCLEAPHLYKKNGYYYLVCAEGGTGYYHSVTIARSKSPFGNFESYSENPIITSFAQNRNERDDTDHLKPHYYAENVYLQKSGHASLVETADGTPYMVHLCSRPVMPEKACVLGRETAIQKMEWTCDGWLKMSGNDNIAKQLTQECALPPFSAKKAPVKDDFNSDTLDLCYMSPRIMPQSFTSFERDGYITLRGQESLCSVNRASFLARRLTSLNAQITVKMDFKPESYRHTAGLVLYYDNMNYVYLKKYFSEALNSAALMLTCVDNGRKTDLYPSETAVNDEELILRLNVREHKSYFEYKYETDSDFIKIGDDFNTIKFSDEYSNYGEFTGSTVGIAATDEIFRRHTADFDYFEYVDLK